MGKIILTISVLFLLCFEGYPQSETDPVTLFAQGHFAIADRTEMETLQTELRNHPYIKVVRLDWETQRLFILTKDITELEQAELASWFGQYAETLNCIQIGIYGIDKVNTYPFLNCEENE